MAGGNVTLQIANDYYSRLAYAKAAHYYEKYLKKNEDNVEVWQKLARCYELTNDYEAWSSSLESIIALDKDDEVSVDPQNYLSYANVLQIMGKAADAADWYEKYLEQRPHDRRAANQLASARESADDFIRYEIENMEFNTGMFEYGPNIFNNTLLYTSTGFEENTGHKVNQWTGGSYSDIRQFQRDSTEVFVLFNEVEKINTTYNDGIFTIDPETEQFYYTRNNYNPYKAFNRKGLNSDHHMNLKIYVAESDLGQINDIREFAYNSSEFNTAHPTISPDGKYLVFVSDSPDSTAGGRDLYLCSRDSSGWMAPVLLTTAINTEGDEVFPAFHADGSLYFSSDGLGSIGGLDIYRAEVDFASNSLISLERLQADINSTYDDFAIAFEDGHNGYFTSDRPGGAGKDDIYSFKDLRLVLEGTVVDAETGGIIPFSDFAVAGKGAELDGKADADGRFTAVVYKNKDYDLFADNKHYYETNDVVQTAGIAGNEIEVVLELEPVRYEVRVVDAETHEVIAGVNVQISLGCLPGGRDVFTGLSGSHRIPVHTSCNYTFLAKTDGYLAKELEWRSPGEDKDETVTIYLDKINFAPIVLHNIYYDFDKDVVRLNESSEDLEKLLSFLNNNPELTIRINSHTDARGSRSYNEELSQRRAQSVMHFLLSRHVDESRLYAKGFGESMPVNECVDGVQCPEEEHQLNRRTEFQVVNADGSTKITSEGREDIKVVPCFNCPF
jgi:outer membrane protein OmpA-like peptidoglycan-associated protein